MKTKQEVAELLTSAFNVNKVWDFIESRPFYNKEYMPKFVTAQQIWDGWGSSEKSLYAKFKWKDKYGGKLHPREIANRRQQGTINKLEKTNKNHQMKTQKEIVALLSKQVEEIKLAAPEDAVARYESNFKEVENGIKTLQAKLKKHQKDFKANPKNWGSVGDISYINQQLKEVNNFIK